RPGLDQEVAVGRIAADHMLREVVGLTLDELDRVRHPQPPHRAHRGRNAPSPGHPGGAGGEWADPHACSSVIWRVPSVSPARIAAMYCEAETRKSRDWPSGRKWLA